MSTKTKSLIVLILRLVAAGILMQTLFFKFTGAPESKFIFSTLGVEPWGRWFAGFSELIAAILLLVPRTQVLGAVMALGVMFGALASHLFILGIVVQNDGGLLFGLALAVTLSCAGIILLRQDELVSWVQHGLSLISTKRK